MGAQNSAMRLLLLLMLPLLGFAAGQFTVTVEEDATGVKVGERATLSARADEDLDTCWWVSPDGVRYRADRDDSDEDDDRRRRNRNRDNYRVRVDDDECSLTIEKMREEDEGPWEAHLDDGDDVVMRSDRHLHTNIVVS